MGLVISEMEESNIILWSTDQQLGRYSVTWNKYRMFSSGAFPGFCSLNVVSEDSVVSIFIGE
jgi:hypothetical protein